MALLGDITLTSEENESHEKVDFKPVLEKLDNGEALSPSEMYLYAKSVRYNPGDIGEVDDGNPHSEKDKVIADWESLGQNNDVSWINIYGYPVDDFKLHSVLLCNSRIAFMAKHKEQAVVSGKDWEKHRASLSKTIDAINKNNNNEEGNSKNI